MRQRRDASPLCYKQKMMRRIPENKAEKEIAAVAWLRAARHDGISETPSALQHFAK
jgi:hypothetical protein